MGELEKDLFDDAESSDDGSSGRDFVETFTEILMNLVGERLGDLRNAAEVMGLSPTYFYRVRSGDRMMSLPQVGRLLEISESSLATLAFRLLESEMAERAVEPTLFAAPAELLLEWRREGGEPASPFIESIAPFLEKIASLELNALRKRPVWPALLLAMEDERLRDWRKLLRRLERLGFGLARKLSRQKTLCRAELVDLSTLLTGLSTMQRLAGQGGAAIDSLIAAFVLAERSEDVWVEGTCLKKAAYLAQDLGHSSMALALINKSALCFSEAGSADEQARALLDRGYFNYYCGRRHEARRLYESGLRRVDPNQPIYRVAGHLGLARIHREDGESELARRELLAAIESQAPGSLAAAYVGWEAARQEIELEDFAAAEKLMLEVLRTFSRQGRSGDLAFVALDYAEILLRQGRVADMQSLVRDVVGWLAPMARATRALAQPFENLAAMLALGNLSDLELGAARAQCLRLVERFSGES